LRVTSTTTYLGFLGGGAHSSSTSMTIVSRKASRFTTNISSEEDCNSRA
jgi:hypothetical protein